MIRSLKHGLQTLILALTLAIVFTGCESRDIAQDLSQREANQIVTLLNDNGIVAFSERQKGGKSSYSVSIDSDLYPQAVSLLHRHNLPAEKRPSVADIVGSSGFLPGSREVEALRLDYALSTHLEEVISAHPNVERVRASVRLHTVVNGQMPAAGLIVQLKEEGKGPNIDQMIQIAQKAIPGIPADRISIITSGSKINTEVGAEESGVLATQSGGVKKFPLTRFLGFWQVPQQHYTSLALTLTAIVLIVGVAAAGLGYWTCMYQKTRDGIETNMPELLPRSSRNERRKPEIEE